MYTVLHYLHLSLKTSYSIISLFMQVFDSNSEVGYSHFCLSTHYQLTQTTVNELILLLKVSYNEREDIILGVHSS